MAKLILQHLRAKLNLTTNAHFLNSSCQKLQPTEFDYKSILCSLQITLIVLLIIQQNLRMSKAPPFEHIRFNLNRKVDRLYFPQHGDPSLYLQCGKKHFNHQSTFRTPYAAFVENDEYVDKLKSKIIDHQPPHSLSSAQKLQMVYNNQGQSQRDKYTQRKDILDEQMDRFDIMKRQLSKQTAETKYRNRQKRLKTQNMTIENYQQPLLPRQQTLSNNYQVEQKGRQSSNYQRNIRQRLKTQSYGQSQKAREKVRFNPTFLSSINY